MPILRLNDPGTMPWPDLLGSAPILILYKHSSVCLYSLLSRFSILGFSTAHPDLPIFWIDVIDQRDFSSRIAEDLLVLHQSPQAIMVAGGCPVWTASHGGLTVRAMEQALADARNGPTR